jgi:hypothetical protein
MPNRSAFVCAAAATLILAASCGRSGRSDSEDGGSNLDRNLTKEDEESLRANPCWRKERGGWHHGIAHCKPMGPSERIEGVFVTAFEEMSFIPGPPAIPDPDDPRRYSNEVELVPDMVYRFAGARPGGRHGDAFALTFIGRRTRDPYSVDCDGVPAFVYVVDRLLTARYLGPEPRAPHFPTRAELRARPVRVEVRHRGEWGRQEAKALEQCRGRAQALSQSSPPGKLSAM